MNEEEDWPSALHSKTNSWSLPIYGTQHVAGLETEEICIDHRGEEKLTVTIAIYRGQESDLSLPFLTYDIVHSWRRRGFSFVWLVLPLPSCVL